mmetsp:Transcript_106561/g.301442  ORF Transcript_106561/g.301442 Transcript_106561/m.301442 type:complete len:201 (-) Transcript_106561:1265-1867(-)
MSRSVTHRSRQKMRACCLRKAIRSRQKRRRPPSSPEHALHENQLILSWHHPLLQPSCVRPYSSPKLSMGVPTLRNSATRKFFICRARRCWMAPSLVWPSTPQFHEMLWSSPLFSPLQALCLPLYETRSRRVKPSCAVTKLMEWKGLRPLCLKRSELPHSRVANSPFMPASPFMNDRTVSLNLPFHSAKRGAPHDGNLPTR